MAGLVLKARQGTPRCGDKTWERHKPLLGKPRDCALIFMSQEEEKRRADLTAYIPVHCWSEHALRHKARTSASPRSLKAASVNYKVGT